MQHSPLEQRLLERCTFPDASHVVCGVSGGPDSTALLILARAAGKHVTVVHVDHGLREDSSNESELVESLARRYGAEFVLHSVQLNDGPNLEARARAARYGVFPSGTLTGHTADDQAETMLLNLMRGAALSGLAGMNAENRPLLRLRRHELRSLCDQHGVEVIRDPTNDDARFRRNRVRHELLPLLDDIADRDVTAVLSRQSAYIREDSEFLDALAAEIDVADARRLASAPLPLARRAVRLWLSPRLDGECHPPDQAAVDRVISVARGEATACDVGNGVSIRRSAQQLTVVVTPTI